jgi:hypothetical protein
VNSGLEIPVSLLAEIRSVWGLVKPRSSVHDGNPNSGGLGARDPQESLDIVIVGMIGVALLALRPGK